MERTCVMLKIVQRIVVSAKSWVQSPKREQPDTEVGRFLPTCCSKGSGLHRHQTGNAYAPRCGNVVPNKGRVDSFTLQQSSSSSYRLQSRLSGQLPRQAAVQHQSRQKTHRKNSAEHLLCCDTLRCGETGTERLQTGRCSCTPMNLSIPPDCAVNEGFNECADKRWTCTVCNSNFPNNQPKPQTLNKHKL